MAMEDVRIYPSSELQKMYTTVTDRNTASKSLLSPGWRGKGSCRDGRPGAPEGQGRYIAAFKSPLHGHEPCIVGMTGDGVNDAVALKQPRWHCRHDATPAAKNAADMILTREGIADPGGCT